MVGFSADHDGMHVFGKIALPEGDGPFPVVVFSHGFGASGVYDSGMEARFVERGFAFAAFDFCGAGGVSKSSGTPLEMSVLTEAADLDAVVDTVRCMPHIDEDRVFLLGSSQGGYVSAYVAAGRPGDVRALGLFFPAFVLGDDARRRLEEAGGQLPEQSTIGPMTVGRRYTEDALSVDIYGVIGGYTGDVLIMHGSNDPIVPIAYSQRALEVYGDRAELVVIDGMGHGFRGGPREYHERAMNSALEFFAARA